ncbi:MAG: FCD domain-containing protein [Clostridiales bacterium]|nr:FCD domain-containing protein [Clostridiales bacterium]
MFDYQRLRYLSLSSEENIRRTNIEEHKTMVDLIVSGDLPRVQSMLRQHLRRIFEEIQTLRQLYPDYIV